MKICKKCAAPFEGRRCSACNVRIAAAWSLKNKDRIKGIKARSYRKLNPDAKPRVPSIPLSKEEKRSFRKHKRLLGVYGITETTWHKMLEAQNHSCAICGFSDTANSRAFPLVDHCHTTEKIRGLLCLNCNLALGNFKDNIESLKKAISYLEKAQATTIEELAEEKAQKSLAISNQVA